MNWFEIKGIKAKNLFPQRSSSDFLLLYTGYYGLQMVLLDWHTGRASCEGSLLPGILPAFFHFIHIHFIIIIIIIFNM